MKRSLSVSRVVFHPSALAVFSGFLGALIGLLLNLAAGGNTSQTIWIALIFAMLFSLSLTAWQMYRQEQTGEQWMTMLQEMVFQTYFLTLVASKPEISQLAQQRLGQVLKTLKGDQQASMVQFFSHNGLPATFIGDALQGSTGLAGADLQQIELPQIHLAHANLSRVNFRGANLTGADLSESRMAMERAGRDASAVQVQVGAGRYPALRANLSHALLSGAKLREATLVGADLGGANLQGADLGGATLTWAILDEADVRAAKVTEEQLQTLSSGKNMKREP
jgi:uncharacterized protein YjbI with pentapeptide repeats